MPLDLDVRVDAELAGVPDAVRELDEAGLVRDRGDRLEIPPEGRLFVRNAAMAFDRYLAATPASVSRARIAAPSVGCPTPARSPPTTPTTPTTPRSTTSPIAPMS